MHSVRFLSTIPIEKSDGTSKSYTTMCNIMPNSLKRKPLHLRSKRGQTLAEYALIIAFISVVAIGTLLSMGGQVNTVYSTVNTQLYAASHGGVTGRAPGH